MAKKANMLNKEIYMPTSQQYEVVKQQLKSFEPLGYLVEFKMQSMQHGAAPQIHIFRKEWNPQLNKDWRFCDPDWDVVSKQLATLYKNIRTARTL